VAFFIFCKEVLQDSLDWTNVPHPFEIHSVLIVVVDFIGLPLQQHTTRD
jgi:hypothetical protein